MTLALVISLLCTSAFAAAGNVDIYVRDISDNTETPLETYSSADLNAFSTTAVHNYSSIDCNNKYRYYTAKGPELEEVLNDALTAKGYSLNDVDQINIVASDDYSFTTTKYKLIETERHWYNTNKSYGGTTPAIIATGSAKGLNVPEASLSTTGTPRNFYGQTFVDDYVVLNYLKNVSKITVYVP